jgi:hypothetical protein
MKDYQHKKIIFFEKETVASNPSAALEVVKETEV